MGSTLVHGEQLVVRPSRVADRVLARAFGGTLDEALAAGRSPESSRLLAARARYIVGLRRRRALAGYWERLLRMALLRVAGGAAGTWGDGSRSGGSGSGGSRSAACMRAVPVRADSIVAAEPLILELSSRLTAPLPVPARGVAMASVLLTDGSGPVYGRRAAVPLSVALGDAITQLDPALPLGLVS